MGKAPFFFRSLIIALTVALFANTAFAQSGNVELNGKLEVKVSDSLNAKQSRLQYGIVDDRGRRTELLFIKEPGALLTGQRIKVKGRRLTAGKIRVGTNADDFKRMTLAALTAPLASGNKFAVILRIQSTTAVSATTEAQLAAEIQAANLRAQEISFGGISISNDKDSNALPDVRTVAINASSAGVGESSAFTFCSQAKSNAAVSGYNHYICILPPDMTYSWYGQAYVGGTDMVINGRYASGYPNGLLHEIGHNWGSMHSNSPTAEYGDSTCIMGGNAGTANRHFNGPQKAGLGWISAKTIGTGSHIISPVESSTGDRLLKIFDSVANQNIYISTRARIGSFSSGPINPGTTHIHTWSGTYAPSVLMAALSTGQSFTQNGITITQSAHDGTNATVSVAMQCFPAAPTLALSPVTAYGSDANSKTFNVTITNKDSNCNPATFNLSALSSSPELTLAFTSSSITLNAGASGATSLTVTPSLNTAEGSHSLSLRASASEHADGTASGAFIFDKTAPTAPANLFGSLSRKKLALTWGAASDSGAGIQDYLIFRNGAQIGTSTANSFSDTPASGSNSYTVKARDRAGNISAASNTFTYTASTGGGKGRSRN